MQVVTKTTCSLSLELRHIRDEDVSKVTTRRNRRGLRCRILGALKGKLLECRKIMMEAKKERTNKRGARRREKNKLEA